MGHEMIFHAWKRFVMLEALSKGTHWGWMAWRSWHYTWPQTEKWEQDQSHQLCGTLKGDAKKTNLSGTIWDHQAGITYPALADTVQRAAAACFPQQKPLPCLAFYQHFWVSPPQGGSTPSCLSRVRAWLLLEVHLALSPLHVPLGWGLAVLDTTWGRERELLQTQSLSPPLSAISTAEPKAALQYPGAAKLLGPEPGPGCQLLRLQESSVLWKKESKCCLFGEGTGWRSVSSSAPAQKEDADAHSPVLLASPFLPPSSFLLCPSVFPFWEGWIKKHKHFWSACSKGSTVL